MDKRNKFSVEVGQIWVDNDARATPQPRRFEIVSVDLDYYPGGRAECKLLGEVPSGYRSLFFARLARFNGTKRGYSLEGSGE